MKGTIKRGLSFIGRLFREWIRNFGLKKDYREKGGA
jgi:hypothetical protein